MTTVTKSIRSSSMKRLADLIEDELRDESVLVDVGYHRGDESDEQILVIGCEQDSTGHGIAAMSSDTRGPRDDTFTIVVYVETKLAGQSALEASERLEVLWQSVEVAVAKNKTMNALAGIVWAIARSFNGPDLAATDTGHIARGEARIEVKTRLN